MILSIGDIRVNENSGLSALHTLFFREHNRIVDELSDINENWDAEILYQEARKIVGAELQNIVYYEWLKKVLNKKFRSDYNLDLRDNVLCTKYDPTLDVAFIKEVQSCAFRYGHSLITSFMGKTYINGTTVTTPLSDNLLNNELFLENNGADVYGILKLISREKSSKADG